MSKIQISYTKKKKFFSNFFKRRVNVNSELMGILRY